MPSILTTDSCSPGNLLLRESWETLLISQFGREMGFGSSHMYIHHTA